MKIKVFSATTESGLENKVNNFISDTSIEVIEMQFQASSFGLIVMITYKQKQTYPSNIERNTPSE